MEILKIGKLPNERRYFHCRNCGAVWRAEKDEYEFRFHNNEQYFISKCPTEDCAAFGKSICRGEAITLTGINLNL